LTLAVALLACLAFSAAMLALVRLKAAILDRGRVTEVTSSTAS